MGVLIAVVNGCGCTYRAIAETASFGHAEVFERGIGLDEAVDNDVAHVDVLGTIFASHRLRNKPKMRRSEAQFYKTD